MTVENDTPVWVRDRGLNWDLNKLEPKRVLEIATKLVQNYNRRAQLAARREELVEELERIDAELTGRQEEF